MSSVRLWGGVHLALAWLAALAGLLLLRMGLVAGVYEAQLDGQEITRAAGYWSRAFATNVSLGASVIVTVLLGWLTIAWIVGRRERQRRRLAARVALWLSAASA